MGSTHPQDQAAVVQRVSPVPAKQLLDARLLGQHFPVKDPNY
jgi:hypothetical protein